MAVLSFKVEADYEKVVKLREEIAKLETQLKGVGKNTPEKDIKELESKLSEAKNEFTSLATEAAKAGSAMDKNFKKDIRTASKEVDAFTAKIIEQKAVVKNVEFDVKRLGEAYRKAMASGNSKGLLEAKDELDAAKKVLDEEKAALFGLTQEQAKARLKVKDLKNAYAEFKDEAGETTKANEGFQLSLGKVAGIIGGVAALKQLAAQVVAVRAQFQDMETQIETLVGKDTTAKIMPQIKEMAKISPLTMTDIVGAEKMMLSFNIEAEKSIDYLKALSDVSMGNSQKFNSLTLAFSQMSSAGRLMGQDLLQMINAGFNPLQIISEKTGKSIAQLKEEMSKGAISAEMVQQAFLDATAAGGKFYNMSENASKTINGQISMMQDAMDAVFNEIGTKTEGVIIKSIQTATKLIQNYEKIGKVLVGLVATYGTYRAAVMLVTAAKGTETLAEIALTKARIAAKAAQDALNASMMTNPYVALAVVVTGLVATMWALSDSTTAAERAQEKYSRDKEEAAAKEKEHADAIQGLIDKVRDETQAEAERILALEALKNEYPNIFAQYDIEKLKLEDILKIKKLINEEDAARKSQGLQDSLADIDAQIARAEAALQDAMTMGSVRYIKNSQAQVDTLKAYREQLVQEILSGSIANFNASLIDASLDELQTYQKQLDSGTFELDGKQIDDKTKETLKNSVEEAINKLSTATSYSQDYKAAQKEWETAKKELDKIEKDKDAYTTKQYEEAKSRKETAEKNFKKLGGDTAGKGAKTEADAVKTYNEQLAQQEKLDMAEQKAARERERSAVDMENMVEQARINAMKEGAAKQRAQQALNNKKELQDLERQKADYIEKVVEAEKAVFEAQEEQKAKNDKTYKKKAFDSETSRASVDTKAYDDAINYIRAKQIAQEDGFVKTLYDQYKSYEDKKKDMEKAYLNDILELNNAYLESGDEKYVRSIEERNKAYIQALNKLESEYGTEDYKLIFGDPEKMTSETIDKALEKARNKMAQLDKEADPETFQALSEAIERLEDARDNNPFQGWDTSVMGVAQRLHQIRNIRKDISEYEEQGNTKAAEAARGQLERSKKDLNKALLGTGISQFGDALTTAAASMREVAKASGDIHLEQQAEALGKAGGFISSVASGAASGGPIGAIVAGATALMDTLISSITESKVVAAEAKKAYEDYLDEIAASKRRIKDEDYETIFGVRALEKVVDAAEAANVAYEQYMKAVSDPKKKGFWQKGKNWVDETDLQSMLVFEGKEQNSKNALAAKTLSEKFEGLFDENGNLVMEEALRVLEAYSKYSNENWYQALSDATEALQDYEDNLKVVDDYLTSLFSNVGSELADAIMQGNDALDVLEKNASDVFASIAKDMIMGTLMSANFIEGYKERLRKAMATEDAADDASVLEDFVKEMQGNITAAKDKWDEIKKIAEEYDIDMSGTEAASQQEASRRGYETLSEDTGNELVGRALAQYESNLRMEEAMRLTKESVDIMAANQVQIRDIAAESRALIADSYLELQQIRENTGAIIKPIKEMNDKMDRIISGL